MEVVGVIPARYQSVRLPGKPLIRICGKPLIEWTYLNASRAEMLSRIIVATDDQRIFSAVQKFGGQAMKTSARCKSGTDRVAEVASKVSGDIFINIQGDEPLLHPGVIDELARTLSRTRTALIATAAVPIRKASVLSDPNVVKVVADRRWNAMYFSRSVIPFPRDIRRKAAGLQKNFFLKHLGIYAYRRSFLRKFRGLPESFYEHIEKLEQLRVLEWGYKLKVIRTRFDSPGIDTRSDIRVVERILRNRLKKGVT